MTTALLIVAVVAALACPLHMVWAMRRGKQAACCQQRPTSEAQALRARQHVLSTQIAGGDSSADALAAHRREANL